MTVYRLYFADFNLPNAVLPLVVRNDLVNELAKKQVECIIDDSFIEIRSEYPHRLISGVIYITRTLVQQEIAWFMLSSKFKGFTR